VIDGGRRPDEQRVEFRNSLIVLAGNELDVDAQVVADLFELLQRLGIRRR
jgi:hypothetical protein